MSKEEDFDKKFSEIAENEKIENVENIVNEEKIAQAKKYLSIIESLNQSAVYINNIIMDLIIDPCFSLEPEICDMIEELYVMSEDLVSEVTEMYLDISFDLDEEGENGQE